MIQVDYQAEPLRFICKCKYDERHIPEKAGFVFNDIDRVWETRILKNAVRLREYFNSSTVGLFRKVSIEKKPWSGRILVPKDKELWPKQIDGVKFAASRNHSYLAFQQRVGKTATGVVLINSCATIPTLNFKIFNLVICPPFLVTNWARNIKEWSVKKHDVIIIESSGDIEKLNVAPKPGQLTTIICPDSIMAINEVYQALRRMVFSYCLVDEAHRFIHQASNRTAALFGDVLDGGIVHRANNVVLLSGTPLRKGNFDLYPALRALAHNTIGYRSEHQYGEKFCGAKKIKVSAHRFVWDYSGASNSKILKQKLKPFMLKKKLDYSGQIIENLISIDRLKRVPKEIVELEKAILSKKKIKDLVGSDKLSSVSKYRAELSQYKVGAAVQYIEHILEDETERPLIFGVHVAALKSISILFSLPIIYGKTKKPERVQIEDEFKKGIHRGIVGNISTMVGQDFSKATRVIFLESSWSPTDNEQAFFRAMKHGTNKNLIVDHLVIANTLDEYVLSTVLRKRKNIRKTI